MVSRSDGGGVKEEHRGAARVLFLRDFTFVPPERPQTSVKYRQGMEMTVRRICAVYAMASGAAVEVDMDE
jgi:hypothetical protein